MKTRMLVVLGAVGALLSAGPAAAADGKTVWKASCEGCHVVMAPKNGDKAAWAPFVKMGVDQVTASVMKGKGMMPPKGTADTEAEVRASVEYILSQMK